MTNPKPLRIAFMGTPDFSVGVLAALVEAGHELVAVYSQPPRKAGRGMDLKKSPVHAFADTNSIEVRTPISLKGEEEQRAFADLDLDVAIVVAYGLLLPAPILEAPRLGCLNLHASLLPRWRGAAPIQRAIMAGDAETGVMVMQMDEGLDTGPVLGTARIAITGDMTASDLHDELATIGAPLMVDTLTKLAAGEVTPAEQSDEGIIYAKKIDKAEARIDWSRPAKELDCHIRGLSPFPGAYFEIIRKGKPERVKILRAVAVAGSGAPGSALDDKLTIACGEGALRLAEVQRAGKGRATAEEFLRGFPLAKGESVS
ncbi:methionyl-tRNA formyltransferase [Rhodobiaceae bacterium]|nr:methionyl-tRNA formyltransferase [Rhodobiaceae bacterium]